jgi:hypothetical protein
MTNEIIQSVVYANYDDFQHVTFIVLTKIHVTILRIIYEADHRLIR